MSKLLNVLRWLTAVATVLILLLLAWQCVDIYLTGNSPANLDAYGVHIQSVYRMDDVVGRISQLAIPLATYGGLILLSAILHRIHLPEIRLEEGVTLTHLPYVDSVRDNCKNRNRLHLSSMRLVMLGVAVLFIVLGVMNGGWYDVLVKAINICTECIGLG